MPISPTIIGAAGSSGEAPTPPSGIPVGADPDVQTISFDIQAYATAAGWGTIPAETGPTQEPIADQGAAGNGVTNDTAAVQAALNALPSTGGVLDLSQGLFAVFNNSDDVLNIGNKDNITIKGGGLGTGLRSHPSQNATGNGFDALLRYTPSTNNQNLVIRDCEFDGNNNTICGITTQNDNGTWIISNYFHDFNDGSTGNAQGAIRGINTQQNNRWIGNYIKNINANSGSAGRALWTSDLDVTGSVVAHNWCEDIGHSGIILHAGDGPLNTIEYNTSIRVGLNTGAACIKVEMSGNISKPNYNQPGILSIYRRNYVRMDFSTLGQVDFGFQVETVNCMITENLFEDCNRGIGTFDEFRKVEVTDNIFKKMAEYAIYLDANETGQDKTGNVIQFNTMSGDGEGMDYGVFFFDWDNSPPNIFLFDDPITVFENKVIDSQVGQVGGVSSALNVYSNFTNTGNGPAGTGARNELFQNTGQTSPPPPTGWTPDDHATLLEWWNGGLGVATSGPDVTSWTGQEAGLIGTPAAASPLFVASSINGKPGINFNSNSRLIVPQAAAINNVWAKGTIVYMWAVIKITVAGTNSRIIDKGFDGAQDGYRLRHTQNSTFLFQHTATIDGLEVETVNTFGNGDYALEFSWDKGATTPTLRVNGVVQSWITNDTGSGLDDDSAVDFCIGGQVVNTTGQMAGHVLALWFVQDPIAQELTDARDYITSEYGLSA